MATNKTIQSINDLSIYSTTNDSYKAPICIVCNCLCNSKMMGWISRKLLCDRRDRLKGDDSLPPDIRKLYTYTGRGSKSWMDNILLSPYASHKQVKGKNGRNRMDRYSCCVICRKDLEKDGYVDICIFGVDACNLYCNNNIISHFNIYIYISFP
jgi:hypothetical protein